jgi:hypothetical protein
MRLPKSKLVTAAAVTGSVCALAAAGAALANPATGWATSAPAIPHVYTNATPALASFELHGQIGGLFVAWKGQLNNNIMYRYRFNGRWSAVHAIPGAHSGLGPAAGFYTDARGKPAEFVAWRALHTNTIYYATGEIGTGTLSWTKPRSIAVKGDTLAFSDTGPAVLFPQNAPNARVIVAWRGPHHHVRYELGTPGTGKNARLFSFDRSSWISSNTQLSKTTTSTTPALAEVGGGGGSTGTIYVFWKADGKGKAISYASTPDHAVTGLGGGKSVPWTLLGGVPGASSTSGPAASATGSHDAGPLLLVYKGPSGEFIRWQTLTGGVWSGFAFVNGHDNKTTISPALLGKTMASVSPTSSGTIYLHAFKG